MAKEKQSELKVVIKAKDLFDYVITVTQKPLKHLRYTFVCRLQNLSMDVLMVLHRTKEVYVRKDAQPSREWWPVRPAGVDLDGAGSSSIISWYCFSSRFMGQSWIITFK